MSDLPISDVGKNLQHLLSEDGHIHRVSKESRKAVADSMAKTGLGAEDHAKAMQKIQDLLQEYKK